MGLISFLSPKKPDVVEVTKTAWQVPVVQAEVASAKTVNKGGRPKKFKPTTETNESNSLNKE